MEAIELVVPTVRWQLRVCRVGISELKRLNSAEILLEVLESFFGASLFFSVNL